jgi:hypothetical protein
MMTNARLTIKGERFEIVAAVLVAIGLTIACVIVAVRLRAVGVPLGCFSSALHDDAGPTAACSAIFGRFAEIDQREAAVVFAILLVTPILAGILVGIPVVSRELERGTVWLPWTLDGSRRAWLLPRLVVLGGIVVLTQIPLALATDQLEAARVPLVNPTTSFADEGVRGAVVVARALAGFALGVATGLLIGRQLPALIVALGLAAVLLIGLTLATDAWSRGVAVVQPAGTAEVGDRPLATRLRDHNGTLYTFAEVDRLQPPNPSLPPGTVDDAWVSAHFEEVLLVVPRALYPVAVALQSTALVAASIAVLVASLAAIERRSLR